MNESRRNFLQSGALLASALFLPLDVFATETSGDPDEAAEIIKSSSSSAGSGQLLASVPPEKLTVTEDNILGPYFRKGAPYRAKITPIGEQGTPLLVTGRVWSIQTRKPLSGAVLEIWHANDKGRYDNDDSSHPPATDSFVNRARLITDENGRYEFESIHPGRYRISDTAWRPAHVHYMVAYPNHKTLITQLYFAGDPYNEKDQFIKQSLIRTPQKETSNSVAYESVNFDIVLASLPH